MKYRFFSFSSFWMHANNHVREEDIEVQIERESGDLFDICDQVSSRSISNVQLP